MSRSYKKTPHSGEQKNKDMKKYANRKLRRALKRNHELSFKGTDYRKFSEYWDICDYENVETKNFELYYQEQVNKWYMNRLRGWPWNKIAEKEPPTREEIWKEYWKWYRRK